MERSFFMRHKRLAIKLELHLLLSCLFSKKGSQIDSFKHQNARSPLAVRRIFSRTGAHEDKQK